MLYDYQCQSGHTVEHLVRIDNRDDARSCHCGLPLTRVMHVPHCWPDGMLSYAPNIGDANDFERRREALKSGQKVLSKDRKVTEPGAGYG